MGDLKRTLSREDRGAALLLEEQPTCVFEALMLFPWSWSDMILCLQGSQPLVGEQIGRLSLASFPALLSEQIMQPLAIEACQEETPPTALVTSHLEISHLPSTPRARDPEEDLLCIAKTFSFLRESGWYWGSITACEAKQQLLKMPEGTFLVRDSTHPSYLFTLSVKTNRGPTNVRIEYSDSKFRLDTNCLSKPRILAFPDVVSLVQHYVLSCTAEHRGEAPAPASAPPVPKEPAAVHLKLIQPLKRKDKASSLQHLCRLRINQCVPPIAAGELPLPRRMVEFLQRYPFQL